MNLRTPASLSAAVAADHRASIAFGLWLRAAFAGVLLLLIGFAMLQNGDSPTSWISALLIGGIALVAISSRRAAAALARMNAGETTTQSSGPTVRRPPYGKDSTLNLPKVVLE